MRHLRPHRPWASVLVVPLALALAACGGGGGGAGPHTISGTLAHAALAQVTLSGGAGGPIVATSDADGKFTFTAVVDGAYVVTPDPARPFQPASTPVNVSGADVGGVDFALDLSASLVLFATTSDTTGNIGGRSGADALCASEVPAGVTCAHLHAVLSVSADDSIEKMPTGWNVPTSRPVRRPSGVLIDTDWPALFVEGAAAAVLETDTDYWTGSNHEGAFDASCSGWTSTSGSAFVGMGKQAGVNPQYSWTWVSGTAPACTIRLPVLCACW